MLQGLRKATSALQAQYLPRILQQGDPFPQGLATLRSLQSARNLTTSAVSYEGPTAVLQISEQQLAEIRQRIFGTHPGNGLPSGRKLLQKKLMGEKIAAYYEHGEPMKDPLIVNLDAERCKLTHMCCIAY